MSYELGLSDTGLVVPRGADYLTEIRTRFEQSTGLTPAWDDDLILGTFSAIMAQLLGEQAEVLQAVYDAFDVGNATGVQLSSLARVRGITRRSATKGTVTLPCTGTAGTVLTIGRTVEGGGSDGQARWILTEDVTIGAGGTVDADFEAETAGAVTAAAGDIDTIVTPVSGWSSVTQAADASAGRDAETDDELRLRMAQSLQSGAAAGLGAIRARLLDLDYIEAASVIDNPDAETRTVEGIVMPARSVLVTVAPDTLTDAQKTAVLQLIYDNLVGSTVTTGSDVVGTVTGADGFDKDVSFDFGDELAYTIAGTLTMASGYDAADASATLQGLVEAYVGSLQIGEPLLYLDLAALARQVPGILTVAATINGGANLIPAVTERVIVGTWSVT